MNNRPKRVLQSNKIKDIAIIQPDIHYDNRGENVETFCADYYKKLLKQIKKNKKINQVDIVTGLHKKKFVNSITK